MLTAARVEPPSSLLMCLCERSELRLRIRSQAVGEDYLQTSADYINDEILVTSISAALVRCVSTDRISVLIPRW